jgi:hypothetical protein
MVQKIDPKNNGDRESFLPSHNDTETDEFSMEIDPLLLFINSIRAEETKKKYLDRLKHFFDYLSI